MQVLYEDRRIIVVIKPTGILSTDEPGGMPEHIRAYLGSKTACVRSVHRLDQPVSGVMVYARSRVAASILSDQVRNHVFEKIYLAVIHGILENPEGELQDYLIRDAETHRTIITDYPGKDVKLARLEYRVIAAEQGYSLLKIRLHTGRTHQIRVQLSSRNLPIVGDQKYGDKSDSCAIALWSCALKFQHPESLQPVRFSASPPDLWPWNLFTEQLYETCTY